MKKLFYHLACLLLLTAGLTACSNDYDDPQGDSSDDYTVILPVPVSDEVKAFFDEELSDPGWNNHGERIGGGFIDSMSVHFRDKEAFYVVNSKQELERIYNGKTPIPDIDFSSYTLLLGFAYLNDSSYSLSDIGLRDNGHQYVLDVSVLHYVHWWAYQIFSRGYYWRLYPKLDKEVVVNKIIHVIE